jgi:biotin carboxyl carrier protein
MKFAVRLGSASQTSASRTVAVERGAAGLLRVQIDDRTIDADAVAIALGVYSILVAGRAFEARIVPGVEGLLVRCAGREFFVEVRDPRAWRGPRSGVLASQGRQQVIAPMPGKVVRVLAAAGETVEAGQGLIVVEAMKMQNEIRAPKSGIVERVFVSEGQAVAAGEPLLIVA